MRHWTKVALVLVLAIVGCEVNACSTTTAPVDVASG